MTKQAPAPKKKLGGGRRAGGRPSVMIHDVAKLAGCSISTVSKALNGTGSISQGTRKRIAKICEDLGYRPNPAAKMLRGQRSENIGFFFHPSCIDLFANPFHGAVAAAAERVLSERNYNFLLAGTRWHGEDCILPKFVLERSVGGLLLLGKMPRPLVDKLLDEGLPFVLLDDETEDPGIDCVVADNFSAASAAAQHLLDKGHRKIAMFATAEEDSGTQARFDAWRGTLLSKGCFDPSLAIRHANSEEGGMKAAQELMDSGKECTAIFCVSDSMAMGAMEAFGAAGVRVPEDISIVGFDDLHATRFLQPALTTIRVDPFKMGELGASILLDSLADADHMPCKRIVDTQLVERESVRAI